MDRQELIEMLNKDLADEHASVIRYLIHAYQAGEDTPLGSMLLSMAREEMWHMDWLADEIGEMEAEPNMKQGIYPHDPTSNASLLRSYIEWEENLVKVYAAQAEQVESAGIKRVLMQQSRESATHSRRFAAMLAKLGPEAEEPLVREDTGAFSPSFIKELRSQMSDEYKLVLQHLRHSFVFEEDSCPVSSELELSAMRHMKHMSYFAEELTDAGQALLFVHPVLDASGDVEPALTSDLELTKAARERFVELTKNPELAEHQGLKTEVEHMIIQEEFLASTVGDLLGQAQRPAPVPEEQQADKMSDADDAGGFTVGSLIKT